MLNIHKKSSIIFLSINFVIFSSCAADNISSKSNYNDNGYELRSDTNELNNHTIVNDYQDSSNLNDFSNFSYINNTVKKNLYNNFLFGYPLYNTLSFWDKTNFSYNNTQSAYYESYVTYSSYSSLPAVLIGLMPAAGMKLNLLLPAAVFLSAYASFSLYNYNITQNSAKKSGIFHNISLSSNSSDQPQKLKQQFNQLSLTDIAKKPANNPNPALYYQQEDDNSANKSNISVDLFDNNKTLIDNSIILFNSNSKNLKHGHKSRAILTTNDVNYLLDLEKSYYQISMNEFYRLLSSYASKKQIDSISRREILKRIVSFNPDQGIKLAHIFFSIILQLENTKLANISKIYSLEPSNLSQFKNYLMKLLTSNYFWQPDFSVYESQKNVSNNEIQTNLDNNELFNKPDQETVDLLLLYKNEFLSLAQEDQKRYLKNKISDEIIASFSSEQIIYTIENKFNGLFVILFIHYILEFKPKHLSYRILSKIFGYPKDEISVLKLKLLKYLKNLNRYDFLEFDNADELKEFVEIEINKFLNAPVTNNQDLKFMLDKYNIDTSRGGDFLHALEMYFNLIDYTKINKILFFNDIFPHKILPMWKFTDLFSGKIGTRGNYHGRKKLNQNFSYFLLHIPKTFDSLQSLYDYQLKMLTDIFNDENKIIKKDKFVTRYHKNLLNYKITKFFQKMGITSHPIRQMIFYTNVLGIARIDINHLSELTKYSEDLISKLTQQYIKEWTKYHKILYIYPKTFQELEDMFFNLTNNQKIYLFNLAPVSANLNHIEFYDKILEYYNNELATTYHRHMFLSMFLKLEQPTSLVSENLIHLYKSRSSNSINSLRSIHPPYHKIKYIIDNFYLSL